jgi:hypothetical protein
MQDLHALGRVDEAIQVFDGLRGALSREGRSPSDLSEAAFRMLKI